MGQYLMATRWYLSHFFSSLLLAHLVLLSSLTVVAQSVVEPEQATTTDHEARPQLASVVEDALGEELLTTEQIEESLGREPEQTEGWVDKSHEYIGTRADDLAIYLDRFFGSPIEDLESADSNVRLTTRFQWDEDEGTDVKFRVRGNVHLPRINERVSLVFNGEDDDFRGDGNSSSEDDRNQVGLQVMAADNKRSRFDLTLSASSDLNFKPGARYRFKEDLSDWGRFRYTARVDYSDKNRFRQRHSTELDYLTGETSLLRWANKVEHGQVSEGIEWASLLSWRYGYSIDSAVAFVLGANGETEPGVPDFILDDPSYVGTDFDQSSLVNNYGVVVLFRNRLYKDWLYIEFEPGYTLRQRHHFEDRHGVFYGRINLELWFNRGHKRKRDKDDADVSLAPERN
jgi:hypothetical protein